MDSSSSPSSMRWRLAGVSISIIAIISAIVVYISSPLSSSSSLSNSILQLKKSTTTEYSKLSSKEKKQLFKDFAKKFNKNYSDKEEESRYVTFENNLKLIDERNSAEQRKGGTAVHGITVLADFSEEEIFTSKMGFKEATKKNIIKKAKKDDGDFVFSSKKDSSEVVDWSGVYTTKIKDQGYCGR